MSKYGEAPRLYEYLEISLAAYEKLKTTNEMPAEDKQMQCSQLLDNVIKEVTSNGKDFCSLCCHKEASIVLEQFILAIGFEQIDSLILSFKTQKHDGSPVLYKIVTDIYGSFIFDNLLRRIISLYTTTQGKYLDHGIISIFASRSFFLSQKFSLFHCNLIFSSYWNIDLNM